MTQPVLFSFFSGSGFLDLGFERNGFRVDFVNEYHRPFLDAYRFSREVMGLEGPRHGYSDLDINEYVYGSSSRKMQEMVSDSRQSGGLIGFIGGPPCPDFSVGGKNRGRDGENGRLTETYVDAIIKFKPDFFIFENVKGLWRTKRHREFYEQMKKTLSAAGYSFIDRLTNSIEYGVGQDRDRVILFGVSQSLFAAGDTISAEKLNWGSYLKYDAKRIIKSVEWPDYDTYSENTVSTAPEAISPFLDVTVQYWFDRNDVCNHANAEHHFVPRAALSKFQEIREGDVSRKSFKRLHRWRYSPTAAYGNNEVHIHPYKSRRISAAEALAIQSLPVEFELPPSMSLTNMFKTIGNGVPYLFAAGVATMVYDYLELVNTGESTLKQLEAAV